MRREQMLYSIHSWNILIFLFGVTRFLKTGNAF